MPLLQPLFPSLGIFSYYFVGNEQGPQKLQETILFGMVSLLTYFSFRLALLIGVRHFRVGTSLIRLSAGDAIFVEPGEAHTFLGSSQDWCRGRAQGGRGRR